MFLLPPGRGKVYEMKRILLILIIITVSLSLSAADTTDVSSTMIVKVNPNPAGFITAKLKDANGEVYDTSKNVPLTISSDVRGVASVNLYYYIIGQGTISITIDSALANSKYATSGNSDDQINYSIGLTTEDKGGITFYPTSISSDGTKTSSGSTPDIGQLKVRTTGTYLLSFTTKENLMSKNYGTYTSSVTVQFQTK